jgi:hypothetical protein
VGEGAGHGADDLCGVIGLASEPFRGGSMQVPAREAAGRGAHDARKATHVKAKNVSVWAWCACLEYHGTLSVP